MSGPAIRPHGGDGDDRDHPADNHNDSGRDRGDTAPIRDPGPGLPSSDALAPLATCPAFRSDAASLGPFEVEPCELRSLIRRTPRGDYRPDPDNVRCLEEWLTGALDAAGVKLSAFDRLEVHLIATDGWGPVQAVAGWITRARCGDPPTPPPPAA